MNVPDQTLADSPLTFAYVATHLATASWVFPTNAAQTRLQFPSSNTRQVVILNTGGNPLLFGCIKFSSQAELPSFAGTGLGIPYAFPAASYPQAAGGPIVVVEGDNCTRIPTGGSFSLDLLSYQERGNFQPVPGNTLNQSLQLTAYPLYLLFFGAIGGDTTGSITFSNKLGIF